MNDEEHSVAGPEALGVQTGNRIVTDVKLHEIEGEPCARDLDIGKRLGLSRPRVIRELIERNMDEIEGFGAVRRAARQTSAKGGRPAAEYWLTEEQSLLVAALSNAEHAPAVRHMLIKVFVAWRRGHLVQTTPGAVPDTTLEQIERSFGIVRMLAHKVTETEKALASIAGSVAAIAETVTPRGPTMLRQGKSAGQIWNACGFPPIKGVSVWFGNRLDEVGCRAEGNSRAEAGLTVYRLFDPDKAELWLKNGGELLVKTKIAERVGQGKLRLVGKHDAGGEVRP